MLHSLYKYLLLNEAVSIPGVGNFYIKKAAGQFNGTVFNPPVQKIIFEPGTALTDKNFYQFIAHEKEFSEVDAVRKFQDFAYQLRKEIQSHSFVELTGIGILKRNGNGEVVFESNASTENYFSNIHPQIVQQPSIENTIYEEDETLIISEGEAENIAKDRWWIWATVLTVLAIAAIALFYFQENI